MSAETFISQYQKNSVIGSLGTKIFPSITTAQAALESNWGISDLATAANNFFGIKADSSWHGDTIDLPTREYINGEWKNVTGKFRKYKFPEDSFRDHIDFLYRNPRYKENGVFSATTPEDQARALKAAGYATDPNYADKLITIINQWNLKKLDQKKSLCESLLEL